MKYIGTTFFPTKDVRRAYEKLTRKDCGQMRIVVKARGRKNAEEICKLNGLYVAFEAGYCSETGNETEITLCDKSEAGIVLSQICGLKEDVVTLEQIIEVMDTDEFWRDEDV